MLIVKKINAYLGLLLAVIAAGICPMLKPLGVSSWNLYKTDVRLFLITFVLIAIMAFCLFIKLLRGFKFFTIVFFIWGIVMAAAVYFKSHNYLGRKFFDNWIAKAISYEWGWVVLLVAMLLLISSVKKGENLTVPEK